MSDVDHQLRCAQEGLLFVRRSLATLKVSGKDRQSWLNGLVTQDLAPRKTGDAALALVVAKNGKIEAEVTLLFGADEIHMGLFEALSEGVREKLDRHLIMEDATIELSHQPLAWALAFGPLAEKALPIARDLGASAGLTERAGLPVLLIASTSLAQVLDAISGRLSPATVTTATEEGWARLRCERGIAERAVDYVEDESYPQEAALEGDEVSFAKGCYLGQEAVFMLEKRGHVSKRLVQIVSAESLAVGAEIRDAEDKSIGKITSAAKHASGTVALGTVKYKHARDEHRILVDHPDGQGNVKRVEARITSLLTIPQVD